MLTSKYKMDLHDESSRVHTLPSFSELVGVVLEKQSDSRRKKGCRDGDVQWNDRGIQVSSSRPINIHNWTNGDTEHPEDQNQRCGKYRSLLYRLASKIPEERINKPITETTVLNAAIEYIQSLYLQLRHNCDAGDDVSDNIRDSKSCLTMLTDVKVTSIQNGGMKDVFSSDSDGLTSSSSALCSPRREPMLSAMSSLNLSHERNTQDQQTQKSYNIDNFGMRLNESSPSEENNFEENDENESNADDEENDTKDSSFKFEEFSKEYPALASLIIQHTKNGNGRKIQMEEIDSTTLESSTSSESIGGDENMETIKITKKAKRPKNGFIRFSVEQRRLLADENQHLDNREVSRMLGAKWRRMTVEEKKPYEQEFKKDIQEIREQNPTWRYAPMKRLSHDQIEPMPSRLRPRDTLKRKFSPLVRGSGKKRGKRCENNQTSSSMAAPQILQMSWIQCNFCSKWRKITHAVGNNNLFEKIWFCKMNPDTRYNSCLVNEEWNPRQAVTNTPQFPCLGVKSETTSKEFSSSTQYILFREPSW